MATKTVKKEKKVNTKKAKKLGGTNGKRFRYILPLLFSAPDGKTVIHKCKILNMKDDKKYECLSKHNWEIQYSAIMPFIIE